MTQWLTWLLGQRPVIFLLAWLSFGCLLGQFYGWWSMHFFGCWVLPVAVAVLALAVVLGHGQNGKSDLAATWIVRGTVGGLIAAVAYDLYRLPFVMAGVPLFKVFPGFGEMILGRAQPVWAVNVVGWAYHFSNGAALGIMFLVMTSYFSQPPFFWGAVLWALFVEGMLLLTPYPRYFGLPVDGKFLFLTSSAHVVFGIVLGLYCRALKKETVKLPV